MIFDNDQKEMLRELLGHDPDDDGRRMTDWEVQFVEEMERRIDQGGTISSRQANKIAEIWQRIFG